jgi:hypothetical protein
MTVWGVMTMVSEETMDWVVMMGQVEMILGATALMLMLMGLGLTLLVVTALRKKKTSRSK